MPNKAESTQLLFLLLGRTNRFFFNNNYVTTRVLRGMNRLKEIVIFSI